MTRDSEEPPAPFGPSGEWTADFWRDWLEGDVPWRRHLAARQEELVHRFLGTPAAGSVVLDAGCGYGRILRRILDEAPASRAVGIDSSASMIRETQARLQSRFAGARAELESIPFADATFDYIVCVGVVMHVRNDEAALHELARTLKPGGTLVLSFNSLLSPFSLLAVLNNRLIRRQDSRFAARRPRYYIERLRASGLTIIGAEAATVICVEPTLPFLRRLGVRLLPQALVSWLTPLDRALSQSRLRWLGHEVVLQARREPTSP